MDLRARPPALMHACSTQSDVASCPPAGARAAESADTTEGELDEAVSASHRAHAAGHAHEPQNKEGMHVVHPDLLQQDPMCRPQLGAGNAMSVRGICALRGVMQAATCRGNSPQLRHGSLAQCACGVKRQCMLAAGGDQKHKGHTGRGQPAEGGGFCAGVHPR